MIYHGRNISQGGLSTFAQQRASLFVLFCLQYAGGIATAYLSWQNSCPAQIDMCLVLCNNRIDDLLLHISEGYCASSNCEAFQRSTSGALGDKSFKMFFLQDMRIRLTEES
jgi:hypothetical protein